MEKRNFKEHVPTERKIDKKDRGDLRKSIVKNNVDKNSNTKLVQLQPDSGDTVKAKLEKKATVTRRIVEMPKIKELSDAFNQKQIETTQAQKVELDRRKVRDKLMPNPMHPTQVLKREILKVVKRDTVKDVNVGIANLESCKIGPDNPEKKSVGTHKDKAVTVETSKHAVNATVPQRRAVLKTMTSKNDSTKIYKAVTFFDRDKQKPTELKVKLPAEHNSPKTSDTQATIIKKVENQVEAKEKTRKQPKKTGRRKGNLKRLSISPESMIRVNSPQTEVAKWAPASINKHTKPYYEAWVNTTLTAVSKASELDKLYLENQKILESFQRALTMRPETPDLVYENYNDERYTGRIKVRQR